MKMTKLYKHKEKEERPNTSLNSLKRISSNVFGEKLNNLDVSRVFNNIDDYVKKYPLLNNIGKKFGVKPSYIIVPFSVFLFLSLVFGWGAAIICNVVGFAYPAYQSFKAVESQSRDETKLWLTYWVRGAVMVYNYIIRPILLKHEKMIDDTVQKISQTATSHLTQITGNLTEKLVHEGIRRRHI